MKIEKNIDTIELILTPEHAEIVSKACELYARIKMGQFDEIPFLCLSHQLVGDEYCARREGAEKSLLEARKFIYPELHGCGHSYGVGKFVDADRAFDVYQVLRYALGDPREPFQLGEPLPVCKIKIGDCDV
jgi:hypothetical protein